MGAAPMMDPSATMRGPYMYRPAATGSPSRSGILVSPLATTSQLTLAEPTPVSAAGHNAVAGDGTTTTVRLVSEAERCKPSEMERCDSACSRNGQTPSPDRVSMVSELVDAYYADLENEGQFMSARSPGAESTRTRIQLCDEPRPMRRRMTERVAEEEEEGLNARKPQLSWFLTLVVLTVVTVVSWLAIFLIIIKRETE